MVRLLPVAMLLAACVGYPSLLDDEIQDDEPPAGARAGMWITWHHDGDAIVEETTACVGESDEALWIEERETRRDGSSVTAKKFSRDGRLLAAWRGPAGGVGLPLRIRPAPGLEDYRQMAAGYGVAADQVAAGIRSSRSRESVTTPAGTFECVVSKWESSFLFLSMSITAWHSVLPLPLSRLVQYEDRDSMTGIRRTTLSACSWSGAVPTLTVPDQR